jgi:mRNA-degrading endonuclease YafQ of YafQ-DinJ toxin-antitoxin module
MDFKVVVTDVFKKQVKSIAKKHSSLKSDLENLIYSLERTQFRESRWVKTASKSVWQ